ncbi:YbaN family protein [Halobacteriovorax sp. GB3]|uniref:YbaN family protein n=1 Tax=Halobacteriovorax sp. GB3 TaxID=2719615 RepID=UPI00236089E3|nr:YbaN family protein [Halobacteriovorax sp. GB3]MDD0851932.1 YbaN family protein [Halobacteriovorax sp. GB3]
MMISKTKSFIFLALGWICIVLAVIGIFLPLLPTTPFLILAAFLFSKGSERLHAWLLNQKTFGPIIRDWHERGAIKPKAKILSTFLIVTFFSYTLIFVNVALWIKVIVFLTGLAVLGFILSRPNY